MKSTNSSRRFISGAGLFGAGMISCFALMQVISAQQDKPVNLGLRVNHVGITVKDLDESVKYYTKTLGFHEAFTMRDKEGKAATIYIQVSKDTFIELNRGNGERPAGLNHVGLWSDDLNRAVAELRRQGVQAEDPRTGGSKAPLTNITDPNGVRLELLEFAPDSMQRKAIDSYKP